MKIFRKTDTPLAQDAIIQWLRELRGNPHVMASGFEVTAVFRAQIGNGRNYYFSGVNVENQHHRLSTHAEEGCIAALATALGKRAEIVEGWVMGAPKNLKPGDDHPLANNTVTCCGKCRQQIAGLASPSVVIHSISLNGDHQQTTVGEFLPNAFTFKQFAPELLQTAIDDNQAIAPTVLEVENRLIRQGKELSENEIRAWLESLESIDFASKHSQAVVLKISNGSYVAGVKVEEAAFVSIDAVQSAIAVTNAEFGEQTVLEVYTLGKGRDEAEIEPTAFMPLTGSAIQILTEFSAHKDIPIHMFNSKGEIRTISMSQSANFLPTLTYSTI